MGRAERRRDWPTRGDGGGAASLGWSGWESRESRVNPVAEDILAHSSGGCLGLLSGPDLGFSNSGPETPSFVFFSDFGCV